MPSLLKLSAVASLLLVTHSVNAIFIFPNGQDPRAQPEDKSFFSRQDAIDAVRTREKLSDKTATSQLASEKPKLPDGPCSPTAPTRNHHAPKRHSENPVTAVILSSGGDTQGPNSHTFVKMRTHKKRFHNSHHDAEPRAKRTFTGFQIGPVLGYTMADAKLISSVDKSALGMTPKGFTAGGIVSLLYAFHSTPGHPVAGLDAAYIGSWAKNDMRAQMNTNATQTMLIHPNLQTVTLDIKEKSSWFAAARFGIALRNVMPYIRIGYSQANYEGEFNAPDSGSPFLNAVFLDEVVLGTREYDDVAEPAAGGTGDPGQYTRNGAVDSAATVSNPHEMAGILKGTVPPPATPSTPTPITPRKLKYNPTVNGPVFGLGVDLLMAKKFVIGVSANYFHLGEKEFPAEGRKMSFSKWNILVSATLKL